MEDIIREFNDKFEHMVINYHKTDKKFYLDILNELKIMNKYIENQNTGYSFKEILINTEKAIILEHKLRCKIISEQFNSTKEIILKIFDATLKDLQNRFEHTNISDFKLICKSEYDLIIAGSFDFAYYHDVEIIFKDVDFIFCPGCTFRIDNFRLATTDEIIKLNKFMEGWEKEGFVTCLEGSSGKFYIVSQQVKFKFDNVLYHNGKDAICTQKISDWAKAEIGL